MTEIMLAMILFFGLMGIKNSYDVKQISSKQDKLIDMLSKRNKECIKIGATTAEKELLK